MDTNNAPGTFNNSTNSTSDGFIISQYLAQYTDGVTSGTLTASGPSGSIRPELAFKYIKSKFGIIERSAFERRIEKLKKAFYAAADNGQDMLGEKILRELSKEIRESALYAKGYRVYIEREDLNRYKHKIKDGHISDTLYKKYTKVIPSDVVKKMLAAKPFFDEFVIYHYYNSEMEKKVEKKQKISAEEKAAMRDPILFGIIKETDRLYFIADWEDEFCDLTFDEVLDVVTEKRLTKYPEAFAADKK